MLFISFLGTFVHWNLFLTNLDLQESDYVASGGQEVWARLVDGRSLPLSSEFMLAQNALKPHTCSSQEWQTLFSLPSEQEVSQGSLLATLPKLGRQWRVECVVVMVVVKGGEGLLCIQTFY